MLSQQWHKFPCIENADGGEREKGRGKAEGEEREGRERGEVDIIFSDLSDTRSSMLGYDSTLIVLLAMSQKIFYFDIKRSVKYACDALNTRFRVRS